MIEPPNCFKRSCKHYTGVWSESDEEFDEVAACKAYPEGIPDDIAYGDDRHLTVRADQDNDIVFEQGPMDSIGETEEDA